MYYDLKERFWWYGMKRSVVEYVAICDTCQHVKAEHQRPAGLLQPLKIPEWKLEEITMDFIVGLLRTQKGYNSIWVVVDRLTKVAHFIPVNTTYSGARLAELYISRIVCLHVCPRRSYPTEGLSSLLDSGSISMIRWIRSCVSVRLITLRQMGRQRKPTKCWRICLELVPFSTVLVGISACHMLSFHTTTATRPV